MFNYIFNFMGSRSVMGEKWYLIYSWNYFMDFFERKFDFWKIDVDDVLC